MGTALGSSGQQISELRFYVYREIPMQEPLEPVVTPHIHVPQAAELMGFSRNISLFLKDESRQPSRSVKGRVAYAMAKISSQSGRPIVESSSGNLALGLAYWCRKLGAPRPLCLIDECCDLAMRQALSQAGCTIEMVPLVKCEIENQSGVLKRVARAKDYSRRGYYWPDQYDSELWIATHERTTGPEIWRDQVPYDLVVGAVGTGATISGIARARPPGTKCRIVAVEPRGSAIFGAAPGPYRVAGAGNPFTPSNYRHELMDMEIAVEDDAAFAAARSLRSIGLKIGSSGAMAVIGALRASECLCASGRINIIVVVADDGWYENIKWRNSLGCCQR
jgi:cysteine synthase